MVAEYPHGVYLTHSQTKWPGSGVTYSNPENDEYKKEQLKATAYLDPKIIRDEKSKTKDREGWKKLKKDKHYHG